MIVAWRAKGESEVGSESEVRVDDRGLACEGRVGGSGWACER